MLEGAREPFRHTREGGYPVTSINLINSFDLINPINLINPVNPIT
jgi:hypothetical protein